MTRLWTFKGLRNSRALLIGLAYQPYDKFHTRNNLAYQTVFFSKRLLTLGVLFHNTKSIAHTSENRIELNSERNSGWFSKVVGMSNTLPHVCPTGLLWRPDRQLNESSILLGLLQFMSQTSKSEQVQNRWKLFRVKTKN